MSEATGPALMAMVKCNGDWPKQLFREDPNDQDTWVITLHNPVYKTGVEMTAVEYPSEYESVPNMDSENENIPDLASRWYVTRRCRSPSSRRALTCLGGQAPYTVTCRTTMTRIRRVERGPSTMLGSTRDTGAPRTLETTTCVRRTLS